MYKNDRVTRRLTYQNSCANRVQIRKQKKAFNFLKPCHYCDGTRITCGEPLPPHLKIREKQIIIVAKGKGREPTDQIFKTSY